MCVTVIALYLPTYLPHYLHTYLPGYKSVCFALFVPSYGENVKKLSVSGLVHLGVSVFL